MDVILIMGPALGCPFREIAERAAGELRVSIVDDQRRQIQHNGFDGDGIDRFVGIVDRSRLTASLLIDVANNLEKK